MHQYWFISCNEHTTPMQDVNNRRNYGERGDRWECSGFSTQFCCKPKKAFRKASIKKKKKIRMKSWYMLQHE